MNFQGLCFCSLSLCISSVNAGQPLTYQTKNGVDILPFLSLNAGYNDNVQRTENHNLSSSILSVSPKIVGLFETKKGIYQLFYEVDAIDYNKSHADNILNQKIFSSAFWQFNIKHRLQLKFEYERKDEPRGTGLTEGISLAVEKPLRYHYQDLYARYIYGSLGAKGRIVTIAGYETKKYNNVAFVRGNDIEQSHFYNWERPYLSAEFDFLLSKNFHAISIARYEDKRYQYIDPTPGYSRNSQNFLLYGGLEWDVSGKTKGTLLLGLQNKDFADSRRENVTNFSWRANISWLPTRHSEIKLEGAQSLHDPDTQGDYVIDNRLQLNWEHHWTPLFSSITSAAVERNEYPSSARKDNDTEFGFSFIYGLTRWLDLSLNTVWEQRKSTSAGFSYDQTLFFFGMETSL